MIVLLKSNWFDGAKYYKQGRIDYSGPREALPSSAIVLSEDGTLPVGANTPKPGFGAKPVEEQIMDLAGLGPTHQIDTTTVPEVVLTEEQIKEREAEAQKVRDEAATADAKATEAKIEELKKGTEAGLAAANKAFEATKAAIDPLEAAKTTAAPHPSKDKGVDPFAAKPKK